MPVVGAKAGSTSAPQQHKQPSRKGRKAWRKNVDVSEVERGLEERNDEIIKGGLVKETESADLFQIEETGDLEVAKKLSKKTKTLKVDEILAQRSAVPAVSGRKRAGDNISKSKTTDGVLVTKRQRKDYVTQKELARLKKVADGHHAETVTIKEATYDLWGAAPTTKAISATALPADKDDEYSFITRVPTAKVPATMKHAPISLAANGKAVPAIAKPKGDLSYNPAFEEYESRLTLEGNKAVEAEKKRLAEEEAERIRLEGVARSAAEADEAAAREALSQWDEDSAWEGFQSGAETDKDNEDDATNAKRPKRKTPAQRNRANRRKEAEAKEKHEAAMRRKQEQAKNIEKLLAEDKFKHEQALALAAAAEDQSDDDESGDDEVLRRRQLGKFHLPEKDLEIMLPDELPDSLRLLKPEGNLLKDRYRSLLVRGKVEARRKRPFRKQVKAKITEKWAHKDFHLF